jgi:hypothetical protein
MYAWPILLPAQTNREDFFKTLSLFDDDTGQAIDVSGRTLAAPGDFTAANWKVTDGNIVTNSVTPLTIKDYPIQNEMQALPLTVGLNLGILAGDFITIADPTGLNTMFGYVTSYVAATGALVVQIGASFDLEIRGHRHHGDGYCDGYGSSSFIGTDDFSQPIIQAQLGSGITMIGLGLLQLRVPASTVFKLRHKTYSIAMAAYLGGDTRQLFLGKMPVLFGGLSTAPGQPLTSSNPFGLP